MLTIIPTPLGNLKDITLRALESLKEAEAILCEDTRRTRHLLSAFQIQKPLYRYQDYHPRNQEKILELLRSGKKLALVSDGGTPVISDPGAKLIARVREEKLPLTVLPGPSAVVTAVAGSGFPGDAFLFLGFLPRSLGKRKKILTQAKSLGLTLVLFESPYRLISLLESALEIFEPTTQAVVARELTKVYEEWIPANLQEIYQTLKKRKEILGECILLIGPPKK
ncbi:MAG: 16S rRNA (cytidine(1402)-2'-O)-methyltransferase [Elusimicrobia bacterium]|nr:16S rRNA (cytidine(1402)-2'-O)-methyltransferase [Elusimicrobiota bacterium]